MLIEQGIQQRRTGSKETYDENRVWIIRTHALRCLLIVTAELTGAKMVSALMTNLTRGQSNGKVVGLGVPDGVQ